MLIGFLSPMNTVFRLIFGLITALALNSSAALIDFNNLPLGTVPDGVYGGDVRITTSSWLTRGDGTPEMFGEGRGTIEVRDLSREGSGFIPSPAIWVRGFFNPETGEDLCTTLIQTDFLKPMTQFSVDLASLVFSGNLSYSGIDANGNAFSSFMSVDRAFLDVPGFAHVDITAPAGGYLTGFQFAQTDEAGANKDVGMDNLSYRVPEVTGWSIIVMSALGIAILKRRLA